MAVYFKSDNPQGLLNSFKKAINDNDIVTWAEKDGYFTHTTSTNQWKDRAFFLPQIKDGYLIMNLIKPKNGKISTDVYAIYHGRIIESLLTHFDQKFSNAYATALPVSGDLVN